MKVETVGILGLGIIGSIWARHYAAEGKLAGTWSRTPQPSSPAWRNTPQEVAEAADMIQIVVADPAAVGSILEKIIPQLRPRKLVVQCSTIDPHSSEEFSKTVEATGARYLEAPFTGSKSASENKQTVFYLGGNSELVAAAQPLLAHISVHQLHIGTGPQACALKLALNLNIAAQMQALAEALTLARQAGLSDAIFFEALGRNAGYSGVTKLKEPKLRARDFSPHFSVMHMHKDVRLAALAAGETKSFPLLKTVRETLRRAEEAGFAQEDFSALIRLCEEA